MTSRPPPPSTPPPSAPPPPGGPSAAAPPPSAGPQPVAPVRTRRWPKRLLIIFLVVANLGIFGALGAVWYAARQVTSSVATLPSEGLGLAELPADLREARTFLLIGSDSREDLPEDWTGFGGSGGQRADVIMLVQVLPDSGTLQMLSIPRDLRVTYNGSTNRINAAFNQGAPAIVEAVSQYAQVPIHHYLEVDFAGFAGIVDAVGGIKMTFPYPARDSKSHLEVAAGTQLLDGRTALAVARSRHYQEFREGVWVFVDASDLGRTRRQQDLLMALVNQIGRPATIQGFGELVDSLGQFVTADDALTEDEIIQLAWEMRSVSSDDFDALTLPVDFYEDGGVSYVIPHEPEAGAALAAFRGGQPLAATVEGNGRVEVQNGNGVAGSAGAVADRLRAGGWEVVAVTNGEREDYAATAVVARPRYLSQAEAVAAFLGYGTVQVGPVPTGADVVVIVGADAIGG
jgi:LCP family protein required for cell wall assembly